MLDKADKVLSQTRRSTHWNANCLKGPIKERRLQTVCLLIRRASTNIAIQNFHRFSCKTKPLPIIWPLLQRNLLNLRLRGLQSWRCFNQESKPMLDYKKGLTKKCYQATKIPFLQQVARLDKEMLDRTTNLWILWRAWSQMAISAILECSRTTSTPFITLPIKWLTLITCQET